MKIWITEFRAEDAKTGEMCTWGGPNIQAPTFQLAQDWCYENAGHLRVIGELIEEIPCDSSDSVDYQNAQLN